MMNVPVNTSYEIICLSYSALLNLYDEQNHLYYRFFRFF